MLSLEEENEIVPNCPSCGQPMKKLGSKKKKLVSLVGKTDFDRNYYECKSCKTHLFPKDTILGVSGTSLFRLFYYSDFLLSGKETLTTVSVPSAT
jgi:hypothetical protein